MSDGLGAGQGLPAVVQRHRDGVGGGAAAGALDRAGAGDGAHGRPAAARRGQRVPARGAALLAAAAARQPQRAAGRRLDARPPVSDAGRRRLAPSPRRVLAHGPPGRRRHRRRRRRRQILPTRCVASPTGPENQDREFQIKKIKRVFELSSDRFLLQCSYVFLCLFFNVRKWQHRMLPRCFQALRARWCRRRPSWTPPHSSSKFAVSWGRST